MSASELRMADGNVSRKFYQQTNLLAWRELLRPATKIRLTSENRAREKLLRPWPGLRMIVVRS